LVKGIAGEDINEISSFLKSEGIENELSKEEEVKVS